MNFSHYERLSGQKQADVLSNPLMFWINLMDSDLTLPTNKQVVPYIDAPVSDWDRRMSNLSPEVILKRQWELNVAKAALKDEALQQYLIKSDIPVF